MTDIKLTDINSISRAVHENAVKKGFWSNAKRQALSIAGFRGGVYVETVIPEKLALIHSEVSEALKAYRNNDMENFGEELADIVIRTMDLARAFGYDIHKEIIIKHLKNLDRSHMHGGKRC